MKSIVNIFSPKTKKILSLSIPVALNSFLDMLNVLIDMTMVGSLGAIAIAAVGLSLQTIGFLYATLTIFYVGTNAFVSRKYGAKKFEEIRATVYSIALIAFVLSIPASFVFYFFNHFFLTLLGAKAEILSTSHEYLNVLSLMLPIVFVKYTITSSFNAIGNTKTPFYIKIISALINLFLNYALIFGHFGFAALGVKGAAIATVSANVFEILIYLYLFFLTNKLYCGKLVFLYHNAKEALKIGLPTSIERILTFGSYLIFTSIIARIGNEVLAGYQIGLRVEGLAFMPGIGFTIAAMTLVGQNIGAKEYQNAYIEAIHTLKIASIFMGSLGIVMILFPKILILPFSNNEEVIKEAALYLRVVGFSQIPLAFTFVLSGSLRGLRETKTTMKINVSSLWIFRIIPSFIVFLTLKSVFLIYLAMILETTIKATLLFRAFKGYFASCVK